MSVSTTPESIVGIIPALQRRKGFLGMSAETFNLIVTSNRLVFAAVSSQTMRAAVEAARQEAREQGQGRFGQFAAQLSWVNALSRQYQTMPIDTILSTYPGSFYLANAEIKKIKLTTATSDDDDPSPKADLAIDALSGKHKFEIPSQAIKDARQILQQTLNDKVK